MEKRKTEIYEHEKCSGCKFRNRTHSQIPCNMCGKEKDYKFFKGFNEEKEYRN